MPISLETLWDDIVSNSAISSIASNPIWIALLITIIILLIMYTMFVNEVDEDTPFWTLLIRSGVYTMLSCLGLLFLHFKVMDHNYEQKYQSSSTTRLVQATQTSIVPELIAENAAVAITKESTTPEGAASTTPVTVAATIQKTGQGESSQIVVPLDAVSVIDGKPVVSGIFQAAHPA